jgi:hypothetical protein
MTAAEFFAASGVFAWAFVTWRAFQLMRGLPHRLRWALWRHKRARVLRRYG